MTTSAPVTPGFDDDRLSNMGIRWLAPAVTSIFEGSFSLLHCQVKGDTLYRGVFAVLLFPVSHPNRFISLRYMDTKDKEQEIGIIDDLSQFPPEAKDLVYSNLRKHYYELIITRVYAIREEFNLLFFEVETKSAGRREFSMAWRGDRTEDYGQNGKVLLDALDNRYLILDVTALPAADQRVFTSFIYW
ncbi:MAG: DUF1854 domain-containing protein [bacterium]